MNFKVLLLYVVAVLSIFLAQVTALPAEERSLKTTPVSILAPEDVLVVDFHGVLFTVDTWGVISHLPHSIIPTISNSLHLLVTNPLNLLEWKEAWREANIQAPQMKTLQALREAKKAGCRIILFSNITPKEYDLRVTQNPEFLPALFDAEIRTGPTKLTQHGYWRSKKEQAMYAECNDLIQKRYPHARVVYFDDKEENLTRGKAMGWHTVLVSSELHMTQAVNDIIERRQSDSNAVTSPSDTAPKEQESPQAPSLVL